MTCAPASERVRGLDEFFCRRNAILPAIRLAITGMPVMPTHDHDVVDVGFEGGDHEQDQHQPRNESSRLSK